MKPASAITPRAWVRTPNRCCPWVWLLGVWLSLPALAAPGACLRVAGLSANPSPPAFGDTVHSVDIEVTPEAMSSLRGLPRSPVPARLRVDGQPAGPGIQLRLKGREGSFRPVDDRPSLTVVARKEGATPLWGVPRLHLNNAAEDPSLLHEWVGSQCFRAAGLPAPDVGHAVVHLNGRRLGVYVLREGFSAAFVQRHVAGTGPGPGVWEPAKGADLDGSAERTGDGMAEDRTGWRTDWQEVAPAARWPKLSQVLDPVPFARFTALEVLIGHRDGYALARNNYRYFRDTGSGRWLLAPHGMDQLFEHADLPWLPEGTAGMAAKALLADPEGRALYQAEFTRLLGHLPTAQPWADRIQAVTDRLAPLLTPSEQRQQQTAARELADRMQARFQRLGQQIQAPPIPTPDWQGHQARLANWHPVAPPEGGSMTLETQTNGSRDLRITAGPVTAASWRTTLHLTPGRYRFSGRVRTEGVVALPFGRYHGAALRVTGGPLRSESVSDTTRSSKLLAVDFELAETAEVALACELRAAGGTAWFEVDSLGLERRTVN